MSENETPPQAPQAYHRELSDRDVVVGKRILYSVAFIGAVLLVSLALPRVLERF